MRVKVCPICRDDRLTVEKEKVNGDADSIQRRECRFAKHGCDMKLYDFDTEHEENCILNPFFHCRLCGSDIEKVDNEKIVEHFQSHCVNFCNIVRYPKIDKKDETVGRKYVFRRLETKLTLIVIEDQYLILMIPKRSKGIVCLYAFSLEHKYRHSNYKIKIQDLNLSNPMEAMIHYNNMSVVVVPMHGLENTERQIGMVIENLYIINRLNRHTLLPNGSHYFHITTVSGEPGSAGNWTKEDLDSATSEFTKVLSECFNEND
jgi:hypothetical protein